MSTQPREQSVVHRVHCADCGVPLMLWPSADTTFKVAIFARDCPECGADVMQQPEEPAMLDAQGGQS